MRALVSRTLLFSFLAAANAFGAAAPVRQAPVKLGVQTPGIQIAMTELKSDADIELPGPAELLASADAVYVGSVAKGTVLRVETKKNKAEALEGITKPCAGILSAFGSLWVPDCTEHTVSRYDVKAKKVTAKVPVDVAATGSVLAASTDSVWVLTDMKSTLIRIDPVENKPVAEVQLPKDCNAVLFGETSIWVTCPKIDKVLRINPITNLVDKRIEVVGQPSGLAAGEGSVWVLSAKEGKVARIDPKTDKVSATVELKIPGLKGSISFGEGYAWVSATGFPLTRIDPATDKVVQQFTGGPGQLVVASAGAVWLADPAANTLKKFDVKRIKATLAP